MILSTTTRQGQGGGPKTAEGRRVSAQNARKHGLRSRFLSDADRKEFERLRLSIHRTYFPEGAAEEELLDNIAREFWRLRRAWELQAEDLVDGYPSPASAEAGAVRAITIENLVRYTDSAASRIVQLTRAVNGLRTIRTPAAPSDPTAGPGEYRHAFDHAIRLCLDGADDAEVSASGLRPMVDCIRDITRSRVTPHREGIEDADQGEDQQGRTVDVDRGERRGDG
jgi:hypothetical protein